MRDSLWCIHIFSFSLSSDVCGGDSTGREGSSLHTGAYYSLPLSLPLSLSSHTLWQALWRGHMVRKRMPRHRALIASQLRYNQSAWSIWKSQGEVWTSANLDFNAGSTYTEVTLQILANLNEITSMYKPLIMGFPSLPSCS